MGPMQSQGKKLAVICNVCFWLTIGFKYWKNARDIQADVLNTIIILGMVAIVANLVWLVSFFMGKKKKPDTVEKNKIALIISVFNIFSLVAQALYLASDLS